MLNRDYIRQSIISHTGDERIKAACDKLEKETSIPSYVIYNFTRCSMPREKDLISLIKTLKLDTRKMFDV